MAPEPSNPLPIACDLGDMATVDVADLVEKLAASNVVLAQFPGGDSVILKGEAGLRRISASGETKMLRCMRLLVANDARRHMLLAALKLIRAGKMSPDAATTLGHMLHGAQDDAC